MTSAIKTSSGAKYAKIMSVGGYRPERIVTNAEICEHIDSSDEWIRERSGIIERRYAALDETVVDMGAAAAAQSPRKIRNSARADRHGANRKRHAPVPDTFSRSRDRISNRGGNCRCLGYRCRMCRFLLRRGPWERPCLRWYRELRHRHRS